MGFIRLSFEKSRPAQIVAAAGFFVAYLAMVSVFARIFDVGSAALAVVVTMALLLTIQRLLGLRHDWGGVEIGLVAGLCGVSAVFWHVLHPVGWLALFLAFTYAGAEVCAPLVLEARDQSGARQT
jgi:hypothetical protein